MTLPTSPTSASVVDDTDRDHRPAPPARPERAAIDDRSLDALEMEAWLSFIRSRNDLMAALERDLHPTGLSLGDYQVFVHLSGAPDQSMRMCDLAEVLQLSPSGLTRRLDGLVRAGWIERRGAEHDRRVMLAVMTDEGRRQFERTIPVHVGSVRRRITGLLSEDELRSMARIFRKVRLALDDADDD